MMHLSLNNRPIFIFFSLLLMVFSHFQESVCRQIEYVADLKLDIQPLPFSLVSTSFLQIDLLRDNLEKLTFFR